MNIIKEQKRQGRCCDSDSGGEIPSFEWQLQHYDNTRSHPVTAIPYESQQDALIDAAVTIPAILIGPFVFN